MSAPRHQERDERDHEKVMHLAAAAAPHADIAIAYINFRRRSDHMTVRDLTAATTLLLLGAGPLASLHAQDAGEKDSVRADARLVRQAITDNILEVRLGQVAQRKATNKAVQGFAQRMVTDHQRLADQWTDLAKKYDITVSDTLGSTGRQKVRSMENASESAFDKDYMTAMLKAHSQDADHLRAETDSARSKPVEKLVNYERPIILEHLQAAANAAKEVGVDSTVVNRSKDVAGGKTKT